MKISLIGVGKVREKAYRTMADEYLKRLTRYTKVDEIEIPDEQAPPTLSPALETQLKLKEGSGILRHIKPDDYVIAMDIAGKQRTSEALAAHLQSLADGGTRSVVFVIGGSLGLSPEVLERSNERMSMSLMTFPHQLARVMTLEQIYRAMKINAGEKYHK